MNLRGKSTVEVRWFALALMLSLLLLASLTIGSEGFDIYPDKESYYPNQDLYLLVSGPGRTDFTVQILNPAGSVVSEERGKTTSSGNAYLHFEGFSSVGEYAVRLLIESNVKAVTSFRIMNPSTVTSTTVTTKSPTSFTVTTSHISSTTPTMTVVTKGDEGGGSGELNPPQPSSPDLVLRSAKTHFSREEAPEFEVELNSEVLGVQSLSESLTVSLEDDSGKALSVEPEVERYGNTYRIEIHKKKAIKPGLYKLVVESDGVREELWFQWGLVSVNTKKSIYHPNETAEVLMVVLDKEGYPVSDAVVQLKVTNPSGVVHYYSTFDSTIEEILKGVYRAYHPYTWEEGNYSLHVTATADGVTSSIESYFLVKEYYEFDILREIPVTIDPRKGSFRSDIQVVDYINSSSFSLREFLPREFNVTDSGGASVFDTGVELILAWNNLSNNSVVSYSAQAPMLWPYLYEIGPAEVEHSIGVFTEARPWFLAVDPAPTLHSIWSQSNSVSVGLALVSSTDADNSTTGTWADANGKWAKNGEWWEFVMQDSTASGVINGVTLYLKHYQIGWADDNYLIQIYNGSVWADVRSYTGGDGPPVGDTTDNWDVMALGIDSWSEINSSMVRIIGNGAITKEDTVDWFVDTVELRINYTPPNQPIVVSKPSTLARFTLTPKTFFARNSGLTVWVNVSDPNGALDIDSVLIEIRNTTGTCKVCNISITDNNVSSIIDGFTYEYNYTIPSDADLGVWTINVYANDTTNVWDFNSSAFNVTLLSVNLSLPLSDPGITESEGFTMNCTASCTAGTCQNVNVYPIYCSGSLTCTPDMRLNTTSLGLRSDLDSINLGSLTDEEKIASFNITGLSTGDYVIACNTTSSNVNNATSLPVNTSLHVNDPPLAVWDYPSFAGDYAHGIEVLNASGSDDSDGVIQYAEFWEDADSGYGSMSLICNDTLADGWTCSWDTTADMECSTDGTCYLRILVVDDDNAMNYSDTNMFIDNTPPNIINEQVNDSIIPINKWICLNATVKDNVNVNSVVAEIDIPFILDNENITLLDDGSGCDSFGGDDVYSKAYKCTQNSTYNWTKTYATDSEGNINVSLTALTWISNANASLIINMTEPSADLRINESGISSSYTQTCNVSCDENGVDCENVYLFVQYKPDSWAEVTTLTTDLVNIEDNFSCGNLVAGGAVCSHNFNITSGPDSGNNMWEIRCKAAGINTPEAFSNGVNLSVNDLPVAYWDYPSSDGQWLYGIELLNASGSTDDVSIVNYLFELDNTTDFTSPTALCDSASSTCSFDTGSQGQCKENDTNCYLRLVVRDSDGATNSSIRSIALDNSGPSSVLDQPPTDGYITSDMLTVNASVSDAGVGNVSWVLFEYRMNETASWISACNDTDGISPHECIWDISTLPDKTTYQLRVSANDSLGNLWGYDTHTGITIDRMDPWILQYYPGNDSNLSFADVSFNFTVNDNLALYLNCSLYLDSSLNKTNDSTQNNSVTEFTVNGIAQGPHTWYVNCSDPAGNWNTSETRSFLVDHTHPSWSNQDQTQSGQYTEVVYRGDSMLLSTYWLDNVQLHAAVLATNESGIWENKSSYGSPMSLMGLSAWSNFTWSNSSFTPGTLVVWRIYANDTTGNLNQTSDMSFRVWGWSKISGSNLNPSTISQGDNTTMSCRVLDNLTSEPIKDYTVSFYNSTGLLGTNITGEDGWAQYTFMDNSSGFETITCNITESGSLYYNSSAVNSAEKTLNTESLGMPSIYRITSDPCEAGTSCRDGFVVYNPNPDPTTLTSLRDDWSIDKITGITQCCTPDGCSLIYCSETPAGTINFTQAPWIIPPQSYLVFWYEVSTPNTGGSPILTINLSTQEYGSKAQNRTDVDIINKAACAWTSWNASKGFDLDGAPTVLEVDIGKTVNLTLRLREFCGVGALAAGSNQVEVSVPGSWVINSLDSRCSASDQLVTCNLTGNLQNSYTDYWLVLTTPNLQQKDVFETHVIGTDSNGMLHEDINTHVFIIKDLSAPRWSNQSQTVDGVYTTSLHWGDSMLLSTYWLDNIQLHAAVLATNESGIWENKSSYGSPMSLMGLSAWSNFTWSNSSFTPGDLVVWRIYANDTKGNLNQTADMSFRIWGWSNLSWLSPNEGNYSGDEDIPILCRILDVNFSSGIENYPVSFYRDSTLIGTNITNSTGYAVYNWNTGSLPSGDYVLKCNITNDADLFYNTTEDYEGSSSIAIDSKYPEITPLSPLSGSYTADSSLNVTFRVVDDMAEYLNCSLYVDSLLKGVNDSVWNDTLTTFTVGSLTIAPHRWNISCSDYAQNTNSSETWNFTVYDAREVNVTLINSSGITFENTKLRILDKLGQEISSKTITPYDDTLSDELALNQLYDLEMTTPLWNGSLTAIIRDLNISGNLELSPQVVENYSGSMPKVDNVTSLYALDDSLLSYSLAELYIPKNSLFISHITHCLAWDYGLANCSLWELNLSEDYSMQENTTHIWFNVTDFDAFGGGKKKPLPNVTEIRVYDVTGLGDSHVGGTLIGSGLDTIFDFYQRQTKTYRVEIDVRNDENTPWELAGEDDVYHEGLNSTWVVNEASDIWYVEGVSTYTGGNWSDGRITWNTSLGGKLNFQQSATFYYVFNMTTSKTEQYPVFFLCNDTSTNSGSFDYSTYNITRVGYFEVNLTVPPQIPGQGDAESNGGYKVGKDRLFLINATVYCRDGFCGNVNGTLRYNNSGNLPDTPVSTVAGAVPFYVTAGGNPKLCATNPLVEDEFCQLSWTVNSTGDLTSLWKLDVLFNSSLAEENNTDYVEIDITIILIMSLSWTEISFGVCSPVSFGNPAVLNAQKGYNISLDENSNDVDELYIKGTDLEPRDIPNIGNVNYTIGVGNLTWNDNENIYGSTNTTRLTYDYSLIRQGISSGTKVTMYYWLDTPKGQYAQPYDGTIYVMVNTTEEF